jgi:hypothetical protein
MYKWEKQERNQQSCLLKDIVSWSLFFDDDNNIEINIQFCLGGGGGEHFLDNIR